MAEAALRTGEAAAPLLAVRDLQAWYGESHILHGVAFDVAQGEVVTLLGRNGAGKTTTLKAIMGVVPRREGSILFENRQTVKLASNRIARLGIAWCPEERGIFASLSVEENLLLPPKVRDGGLAIGGLLNGPMDIGLFTIRQRRTDPAWMGRAFAVSMAFNFVGYPIGAALAGSIAAVSIDAAIVVGAAASILAGVLAAVMIPRREAPFSARPVQDGIHAETAPDRETGAG